MFNCASTSNIIFEDVSLHEPALSFFTATKLIFIKKAELVDMLKIIVRFFAEQSA
jgi:hypothetical protein